ncbi:sigma-E factor negative regulatory protein [Saccharospirillum salsuginis]|uniref:Anti sigma-E protein RseA N-terminal domain-containing protein n=1 Tax=Saccharospirillum salsuginis TaxID=418750 RepID=A0A918NIF9_9GAMM|nr:sigma-E factor negative regulatory protein [Saccharospirillum salsuginis]GGX69795.1 hypothetical protein GCM10007392_41740 [Saccharospirillum salsuginis]
MNDRVNESFSAFLDGEASEVDIQRLMKALDKNPELLDDWHRLSQVQAAMAGDVVVDVGRQRLDDSAGDHVEPPAPRRSLAKRLSQMAVAAGVAVVVVIGARWETPQQPDTQVAGIQDVDAAQARFEAQQRLNSYLRQHAEAASYSSGHAVVPSNLQWEASE